MTKLKITVLKRMGPEEIFDELPVNRKKWMVPCPRWYEGQEFVIDTVGMPVGFCDTAWNVLYPFVRTLFHGGDLSFYDEKGTAILSCVDGLTPVIFKIEKLQTL